MTKHLGKDGLESKVTPISPKLFKEEKRQYLPICTYSKHVGIIRDESVCISRKCPSYYKAFLEEVKYE